jgi:anti-anti-sigma regulatory factor
MSIELQQSEDRSVVRLAEPITVGCASELHKLLVETVSSNRSVAIDLEGVTELDVSAIQLLYAAGQAAERAGISFSLQGILPEVVKSAFLDAGLHPFALASGPEVQ